MVALDKIKYFSFLLHFHNLELFKSVKMLKAVYTRVVKPLLAASKIFRVSRHLVRLLRLGVSVDSRSNLMNLRNSENFQYMYLMTQISNSLNKTYPPIYTIV